MSKDVEKAYYHQAEKDKKLTWEDVRGIIMEKEEFASIDSNYTFEEVINYGLRFEDSRIYSVEIHRKPNRAPYEVKKDVTEDIARVIEKYTNE